MRNKIIYSNFDKCTGVSKVTIKNKYGTFTGKAKLNPNDTSSSYQGCRIAEKRAVIKCLKYKKKKAKEKYNICQRFHDVVTSTPDYNPSSSLAIEMRRYLMSLQRTCDSIDEQIIAEQEAIEQDIKDREEVLKHFAKYRYKHKNK